MKIEWMGRESAERYQAIRAPGNTALEPYVLIGLIDPGSPLPVYREDVARKGLLVLHVSDLACPIASYPDDLRKALERAGAIEFTNMAKQIATFIWDSWHAGVRSVVVHCEAGISRSAGVAAAVAEYFGEDTAPMYSQAHPNALVKGKTFQALCAAGGE